MLKMESSFLIEITCQTRDTAISFQKELEKKKIPFKAISFSVESNKKYSYIVSVTNDRTDDKAF